MKKEDVKIGMKVVPHTKSLYSTFNEFKMEIGEYDFLYVIEIDEENNAFGLEKDLSEDMGYFFRASDFELYKESGSYSIKWNPENSPKYMTVIMPL